MKPRLVPDRLPPNRYATHPWKFSEIAIDRSHFGVDETLFSLGNGYIGLRGDHDEGRDESQPGTYINGFHETWSIHHAEDAFGFATTGQTIVNAPDAKIMSLYVDDELFELSVADLERYERTLDFQAGTLVRDLVWRMPGGNRVRVRSERIVSLTNRHAAALRYEVTMLDGEAPVMVVARLLNREDAEHMTAPVRPDADVDLDVPEHDPRRHRPFAHQVLQSRLHEVDDRQATLAYQCANSRMSIALSARHDIECDAETIVGVECTEAEASVTVNTHLTAGQSVRVTKFFSYHTSRYSAEATPEIRDDADELARRCWRTLDRIEQCGFEGLLDEQRRWLDEFWENSDVQLVADDPIRSSADQQALRWNLFQLAQASAQTDGHGIAAKGVSGGGYEGHYFWDTEMYVVPFLAYTCPSSARTLLRFRWQMLPTARRRARLLNQVGALYPWRTINGEEASAYYAAGTAQYHINAAIAFALKRYVEASGDMEFLATDGAEILVGTARLWEDLGFYSTRNGSVGEFHIHGVTGPDEYTAMVNDNLYTNVMARFNLRWAARVLELLQRDAPREYADLIERVDLGPDEISRWIKAADSMFVPYDEDTGIHPQDIEFLESEPWDFEHTPPEKYPLLLHFHPLVIYRHQVLKQADVVLAMSLRNDQFPLDVRRRDFDYYDPITTGDSSLSACVQAMAAAQIGYDHLAIDYFREALYVDLADLHGNTADGVHVASAGGVWGTVAFGFAGLNDTGLGLSFEPSLPPAWQSLMFHMQRHGSRLRIELDADGATAHVLDGDPVPVHVTPGVTHPDGDDDITMVKPGDSIHIPRAHLTTDVA